MWDRIIPALARTHRVIAPDLRGLGGSARATEGYDALTITGDMLLLLDRLGIDEADVVAIDLGVPPALLLALSHPHRLRRLVVMESLAGPLPGAERFLAGGPPWWFGFHAVLDLPERVLDGHETLYLDHFLDAGTMGRGVSEGFRQAVISGYSGVESLRCAFDHYRALPASGRQIIEAAGQRRITAATMTVGAFPVGDALFEQLRPLTDDLVGHVIAECGHIIPQDRPAQLLSLLEPFLA